MSTNITDGANVVEITDLKVRFATDGEPVAALDGVSLAARPGEVLAIVGESGSGKSVTAQTLLGLLPETASVSGAVIIRGHGDRETDVVHATPAQLRRMRGTDAAMVFQEPSTALNPVYTVGWQIAEGIRAHQKVSKAEARVRAIDVLRRVGIPDPENRVDNYPHQFSGGQKQRVVIAMALVMNARLIIADEPTTALDVTVQAEILDLLRTCRDEFGATVVLITHNMGVVAELADRVIVMYRGKIVEQAPCHTWGGGRVPSRIPPSVCRLSPRRMRSSWPGPQRSGTPAGLDAAAPEWCTESTSGSPPARCWAWSANQDPARRRSVGP